MQAYEVSKTEGVASVFAGDLAAVRQVLRTVPKDMRDQVRIYLVAVPDVKAERIRVLNGAEPTRQRLTAWRIGGARGGRLVKLDSMEA